MLTTLLTLLQFLVLCFADGTHRYEFLSDELASECRFELAKRRYDLCPIINSPNKLIDKIGVSGSESALSMVYKLTLAGYHHDVEKNNHSPAHVGDCPDETWICATAISFHPHQPTNIVQVFPVAGKALHTSSIEAGPNAEVVLDSTSGAPLILHLRGGFLEDRPQSARIEFICDPKADEPTTPQFSGKNDDVHSFVWSTKHACSLPITSPSPLLKIFEGDLPNDETLPEENETPEDGQELLDPMSPPPHSRRSTAIIILLTGSTLIVLCSLFYSTSVRQFVLSYVKRIRIPTQFRVGEGRLIRWAQEDMELVVDEEDVMVNADTYLDGNLDLTDEYIPLKPSPRKSFLRNYGSARPW